MDAPLTHFPSANLKSTANTINHFNMALNLNKRILLPAIKSVCLDGVNSKFSNPNNYQANNNLMYNSNCSLFILA